MLSVLAVLAVLAGCGGGSGSGTAAKSGASGPDGSQPSAGSPGGNPGGSSQTQTGAAGVAPKVDRKALQSIERSCVAQRKAHLPRVPRKPAGMPRYARAVLPAAVKMLNALSTPDSTGAKARVAPVVAAYGQLMPYLQELASAPPGPPSDEIKRVAVLLPPSVAAVQATAVSAGVPACGLPLA